MDQDTDLSRRTIALAADAANFVVPAPFSDNSDRAGISVVDADFVAVNGKKPLSPKLDAMPFLGPGAAAAGSVETPVSQASVFDAPFNSAMQPTGSGDASQPGVLDAMPLDMPEEESPPPPKKRLTRQRLMGLSLLVFGVVAALLLGLRIELNKSQAQNASLLNPADRFQQQELPLSNLNKQLGSAATIGNSSVTVNSSLVLAPSVQPSNPLPGQFYYDQTTNKMMYYDGTGFVPLQGGNTVTNNFYSNSTVTNNYANSTVNNTFITNNIGASINGTPGILAMFGPGGSVLADSRITQSGNTVSIATTGGGAVNIGASIGGGAVTIAGAAPSSFTTSTGSLTLGGGGGAGGGVIVKPQADSTTAFEVQNASGSTNLLNVDTLGNAVTLGVGSVASFGNTRIGNVGGCCNIGKLQASKFTTIGGGTVNSISAFVGWGGTELAPNNKFQLAIYADNGLGTAPGAYISSTAVSTLTATTVSGGGVWNTLPINATLSAGTTYWLAYWNNTILNDSNNALSYSSPANGALYQSNAAFGSGSSNGMPAAYPVGALTASASFSMYASFSTTGPALTLGAGGLVTASGPVVLQDPTNSATAFQVQDNVGNTILTVDTSNSIVKATNLAISGHITTSGTAPTIAAGAAACTTPTVSVAGNDTSGVITITTGTGCSTAGKLATLTFANVFSSAPHVLLSPVTATAEGKGYVDAATVSTTTFDLDVGAVPASSTIYKWNYVVIQ